MSITIKQFENQWRISISDEEWKFEDLSELEIALNKILDLKGKHGKIFDTTKVKGGYY